MEETWQKRAKSAMKNRGITQAILAEKLEMTQGGLGHWLSGRNQPSLDDINRIADQIGVSRTWVTHGVGYADGPGRDLLELLLSGMLSEIQVAALWATSRAFVGEKEPVPQLGEMVSVQLQHRAAGRN